MKNTLKLMVAALALVMGSALRADEPLILGESTTVPAAEVKEIRQMLSDYVAAVKEGDRAKAMKFCTFKGKEAEKISGLSCDVDFAIVKMRDAVEKKLGKDAWKNLGEMIGEMTPEGMKIATVKPTENPDEARVTWTDKSKLPEEKRLTGSVVVRREKGGWKFALVPSPGAPVAEGAGEERVAIDPEEVRQYLVQFRRVIRDEIAEINEITDGVTKGTLKDAKAVEAALAQVVKDVKGPVEDEGAEGVEGAPGVVEPMAPGIEP